MTYVARLHPWTVLTVVLMSDALKQPPRVLQPAGAVIMVQLVFAHVCLGLSAVRKLSGCLLDRLVLRNVATLSLMTGSPLPPSSLIPLGMTLNVRILPRRDSSNVIDNLMQLALVIVTPMGYLPHDVSYATSVAAGV